MAVRVILAIRPARGDCQDVTVLGCALANAGYETDSPELLLPVPVAERLGLWTHLPPGAVAEDYAGAEGGMMVFYRIPQALLVRVQAEGARSHDVRCDAAISRAERQLIMNDRLCDRLRLSLIAPGKGIWRFGYDSTSRRRKSHALRLW